MSSDWTETDIPDQSGTTVLITGANSGIGFEAARALAEKGATVVMGCRNRSKAETALAEIEALRPSGSVEILELDLADLGSVRVAADTFLSTYGKLDILVNNAGLMATPEQRTAQGFEMQFGVNHLGHFALTGLLLDLVNAADNARVVTISSVGHKPGKINFDDLNAHNGYSAWRAYFQSKLANLLFTRELQHRLASTSATTLAVAAHPGSSDTNLGHENPGGILGTLIEKSRPLFGRFTQDAAMGALPTLRAATDPTVAGNDYYGPDGRGEQKGHPVKVSTSKRAQDDAVARRLWEVSEELTGVTYEF